MLMQGCDKTFVFATGWKGIWWVLLALFEHVVPKNIRICQVKLWSWSRYLWYAADGASVIFSEITATLRKSAGKTPSAKSTTKRSMSGWRFCNPSPQKKCWGQLGSSSQLVLSSSPSPWHRHLTQARPGDPASHSWIQRGPLRRLRWVENCFVENSFAILNFNFNYWKGRTFATFDASNLLIKKMFKLLPGVNDRTWL